MKIELDNVAIEGTGKVEDTSEDICTKSEDTKTDININTDDDIDEANPSGVEKKASEDVPAGTLTFYKDKANPAGRDVLIDPAKVISNPIMRESNKEGFDKKSVQAATSNSEKEGGVFSEGSSESKSPYVVGGDESATIDGSGYYELAGFYVSYETNGGTLLSVSGDSKYKNIDLAKACVNGSTFLMLVDGVLTITKIISGAPEISHKGVLREVYIDGAWRTK